MRTKSILLGAALLAAGIAPSMAQVQSNVFSVNVVGYVNVNVISNKFHLIENPLNANNNNIVTNVISLPDSFDSSLILFFQGGAVQVAETFIGGFGWFPGTNFLNPGKGFYFYATTNGTITFSGSVQTNNTIVLTPGFNMVASAYPGALSLTGLGLNGVDSDLVLRFSPTAGLQGALNNNITFIGGYGWFDDAVGGGGPTNGPTLNVAEGVFYNNAQTNNNTWTENFTIN